MKENLENNPVVTEILDDVINGIEVEVTSTPKKRRCFRKFLLTTIILGILVYVVQKLLTSKDDGWTPYKPSEPYTKADEDKAAETAEPEEAEIVEDESQLDPEEAEAAEVADATEKE